MNLGRYSLALLLLAATPLQAQGQDWGPSGIAVCGGDCVAFRPRIIPDGEGGAFIAWIDYGSDPSPGNEVYVQRITAAGAISPGWPPTGLLMCDLPTSQELQAIAPDGQGGVFVVWTESRGIETSFDIFAQRVLGDGTFAPGWPLTGAPVTRGYEFQEQPSVVPDGSGGAYFAWHDWRDYFTSGLNVYAQHLSASGDVVPGWPADGLRVCSFPSAPGVIVPDGEGGAYVAWGDGRRGLTTETIDVYMQRLLPDGSIAPGWTQNGVFAIAMRSQPQLLEAANGDFYLATELYDFYAYNDLRYTVQRFTAAGAAAPGWPAEGVEVCGVEGNRDGLVTASDRQGGILLAWFDARAGSLGYDIWASRVLPTGTLAPGWPEHGLLVSRRGCCSEVLPDICADGSGGAYVAWEWPSDFAHPSLVHHISADGTAAAGWPENGIHLASSLGQFDPQVAPDGAGGVIVAWEEAGGGRFGIFANHFSANGAVSALVSLASVEANAERVVLLWYGRAAVLGATRVYRRQEGEEWQALGWAEIRGDAELLYEDRTVMAGQRYAYRLGYARDGIEQFTDETWVEVPFAATLRLDGFAPNPASGTPTVSFSLENSESALLEVFNASGRRLASYEVGDRGAGTHLMQLDQQPEFSAGVYWMRLSHGLRSLTAKGIILR
jgi:hypothetical protein